MGHRRTAEKKSLERIVRGILGYWRTWQCNWLRDKKVESSTWWFTVIFYNSLPRPRGVTGWQGRRKGGDSHHQWRTNTQRAGQRRKKKHVYNLFIQFCIFFFFHSNWKTWCFYRLCLAFGGHWVSEYWFQWRGILKHSWTIPTPITNHSQTFFQNHSHMFLLPKYIGIRGLDWFNNEETNNPDVWFSAKRQH